MKFIKYPCWRNHHGQALQSYQEVVRQWLATHPRGEVYVGCDSKVRGQLVKYSTVICFWNVGRGVSEIYKNETEKAPPDAYTRLWNEVTRAVDVADSLKDLSKITVHVDINSSPKYRSHRLYDASIGLINSMGFKGAGKPFSWAASCGAHRHCQ
ncbi:MAG: ribonuclease H-like YkuK family protein [Owenweeksia sp.]|nr:ribonuclease H-like YkuK family protein [Owenweeksia sp.]